jgi:hypothetical protein
MPERLLFPALPYGENLIPFSVGHASGPPLGQVTYVRISKVSNRILNFSTLVFGENFHNI